MKYELVIAMPGETPYRKTFPDKGTKDAYMRSLAENNPGAFAHSTVTPKAKPIGFINMNTLALAKR